MNVKLLRIVDKYIIGLFILIFFWLKYLFVCKKKHIIQHPKKILVIRLWALGSSLLTFPMIQQLKEHYGNGVQYDLLASSRNSGVFKNQGYFNQIYNLFSLKGILKVLSQFKQYDIVIDAEEYFMISAFLSMRMGKINVGYTNIMVRGLAYNSGITYNDQQHSLVTTLDLIKKIGIPYRIPESLEPLKFQSRDTIKVDVFLQSFKLQALGFKLICMHTGGAETAKERSWPQTKWVQLISSLCEKYPKMYIFLSGTDFEKHIVQNIMHKLPHKYHDHVINICGMFTLFEFAYLLEKCDLMISNDTGPMHLAAAMGTKTIGLFGPELPRKFGPWPLSKNVGLYKGKGEAFIKVHLAQWKKDKNYTIDRISVEDVMKEISLHK